MSDIPKQCSTCRFWDRDSPFQGQCRRYPPVLAATAAQQECMLEWQDDSEWPFEGVHPWTIAPHWCGEYQVRS